MSTMTEEDRWAEARLRLEITDKRMRLLLAAAERGYDSIEQLEGDIRRSNTAKYQAEIDRSKQDDDDLAFLLERHNHPERFPGYAEPFTKRVRETFNGRELKRYGKDGALEATILCTSGNNLGMITSVH